MTTPNGCSEFIYIRPGLKVKGYDNCSTCNRGINMSDKYNTKIPDYVEIECPNCGGLTRLPIFKEEVNCVPVQS